MKGILARAKFHESVTGADTSVLLVPKATLGFGVNIVAIVYVILRVLRDVRTLFIGSKEIALIREVGITCSGMLIKTVQIPSYQGKLVSEKRFPVNAQNFVNTTWTIPHLIEKILRLDQENLLIIKHHYLLRLCSRTPWTHFLC